MAVWKKSPAAAIVLAAVLVGAAFAAGRLSKADVSEWTPPEPDYTTLTKDELSWVQEGIMERISELEDELRYVQRLQEEKSVATD